MNITFFFSIPEFFFNNSKDWVELLSNMFALELFSEEIQRKVLVAQVECSTIYYKECSGWLVEVEGKKERKKTPAWVDWVITAMHWYSPLPSFLVLPPCLGFYTYRYQRNKNNVMNDWRREVFHVRRIQHSPNFFNPMYLHSIYRYMAIFKTMNKKCVYWY